MSMKPTYEQLEAQVLELSVKLANVESKCAEVVAELSAIEAIHNDAVFITDEHYEQCPPEAQKIIGALAVLKIPAYDAHLAELRAQGVEALAAKYESEIEPYKNHDEFMNAHYLSMQANAARKFAAQLRQGEKS
ncbi:Uncharacterised protein [Kluyvera cryocrescens]|nr:Uncharacterised protein [Kluyvera cryocrescens]